MNKKKWSFLFPIPLRFVKNKWLLWFSLTLNILFVLSSILLLPQRGASFYLFSNPVNQTANNPNGIVRFSNYYLDRKSLFDILPSSKNAVIFLGDSITNKCEWAELFGNQDMKNRGINGDNTYGLLKRLDQITNLQPKKIFIMIGINDIIAKEKTDSIIYKYRLILRGIKQSIPGTQVFVQSVLPVNNRLKMIANNNDIITLNNKIKILSEEFQYKYIDLYSIFSTNNQLTELYTNDGIHLNGIGYLTWKQALLEYID
ncbi:MAG TPA: G-D-S-L family lipolytic protein [Cyanobacteria bacterium UBA8553]|nr:G-D-S-L family lipolytic protein [Cyanobacteria bacterium UBA8553]HAJ61632.1 G-D-S-L family lipolytic protein [Cyanobacteria bacterium UBA8543]